MARKSHIRQPLRGIILFSSSTWGRADQHTSQDSNESGAFCFAFDFSTVPPKLLHHLHRPCVFRLYNRPSHASSYSFPFRASTLVQIDRRARRGRLIFRRTICSCIWIGHPRKDERSIHSLAKRRESLRDVPTDLFIPWPKAREFCVKCPFRRSR
jgi:hypothetical protein